MGSGGSFVCSSLCVCMCAGTFVVRSAFPRGPLHPYPPSYFNPRDPPANPPSHLPSAFLARSPPTPTPIHTPQNQRKHQTTKTPQVECVRRQRFSTREPRSPLFVLHLHPCTSSIVFVHRAPRARWLVGSCVVVCSVVRACVRARPRSLHPC